MEDWNFVITQKDGHSIIQIFHHSQAHFTLGFIYAHSLQSVKEGCESIKMKFP
jgi:hypothetical protein